jgi:hypothetical protein
MAAPRCGVLSGAEPADPRVTGARSGAGGQTGPHPAPRSPPVVPARPAQRGKFQLDLRLRGDRLDMRLGGRLSIESALPLAVVLASLNRLAPPVIARAGRVNAVDVDGVRPLFEIARYRREHALAPLVVAEFSDALRELFTNLQVPCTQRLDVDAWDLAQSRLLCSGDQHRGHLRLVHRPDRRAAWRGEPSGAVTIRG